MNHYKRLLLLLAMALFVLALSRRAQASSHFQFSTIYTERSEAEIGDGVLVFTELMYHPTAPDTEWIELQSLMAVDLDISGWALTGGVEYTFPEGTVITAGEIIVVAADVTNPLLSNPYGPFTGSLANGGEVIQLRNNIYNSGRVMDTIAYKDEAPWPAGADGSGATLAKISLDGGSLNAVNWRPSEQRNGTPDTANFPSGEPDNTVVFNELGATADFFVELTNVTNNPIALDNYELHSSAGQSYLFPATNIPAGGFVAVDAAALGFNPTAGEKLFLFAADGVTLLDALTVEETARGRVPDGTGDYFYTQPITPSAANMVTLEESIVINEIMYHHQPTVQAAEPSYIENPEEWLELYNRGPQPLDLSGWSLADGIQFDFPNGTLIDAGGYLVIAKDAHALRLAYPDASIIGNFDGSLSNQSDRIVLLDTNGNVADEVTYYEDGRWDERSDGRGSSLELRDPFADNDNPEAWGASDESGQSEWLNVSYDAIGAPPTNSNDPTFYNEFIFGLLGAGEILIDDISVIEDPWGTPTELIQMGDFENADPVVEIPGGSWGTTADPDTIIVTADNGYTLYVNGVQQGTGANWQVAQIYNIDLEDGDVIAIDATDAGGAAALLVDLSINGEKFGTDEAWKVSTTAPAGWNTAAFEDCAWDNATIHGSYGDAPWNTNAQNVPVNTQAKWIWSADNNGVDEVYVRYTVGGSDCPLPEPTVDPRLSVATWRMLGNHGSHGLNEIIVDPDDAGNKVLKVVATGETEHMHNHLETTLKKNDAYYTLSNAQTYRISFRARWLSGVPRLHTRLYFNRAARTTILPVPTKNGTPGAQNSLYTTNWGPQYENLQHSPLIPEANEPVTVKVHVWDADGVQSAVLYWSADNSAFISTTMSLDGDGFYAATIPGQAADTVVQFYVVGEDTLGAMTYFPAAGPDSRALYEVNDGRVPAADVHNLRIMLTPEDESFFHDDTNVMSNDLIPATVIYNESEVFYDVRIRLKGSQHGRWTDSRASYVIHFPADHLFRGVHNSVKIDRTGVHELIHWQILNRAGGLLGFYNDVVNLMPAKEVLTTRAQLVLGGYVDNVMDAQYEDGSSGPQYKLEYIYRTTSTVGSSPEGLKIAQNGVNALPGIQNRGNNPEAYRWNYLMRNNHFENDYQPLIDFIQAADQPTNDFLADIESVIEVDEWLRAFAFLATINMTDHYYNAQHHNSIFYALPSDQRLHLLIWDTDFFEGSVTNPVNKNIQLQKLLADPIYARIFYGHLDDFLTVSYNNGYLDQWIQHYRDKTGAVTYFGGAINVTNQQNRVTSRVNYLRGQINTLYPTVAFDITTNGGGAFVTTATSAVLEGTGWINVREIELVNTNTMLEVTWLDADSWQVEVPLVPGANNIQLQAYDFQGKPLNSDIIQITSNPPIELADMSNLLLTEIQYNPHESIGSYEYLEFKNISAEMVNLGGTTISGAVTYTFPPGTTLAAGEFILVAADLAAFNSRYVDNSSPWYTAGLQVVGPWAGSLSNGGEEIIVTNLNASEILRVTYDDGGAWPGRADGDGSAAELETPAAVPMDTLLNKNNYLDNGNNWRPTSEYHGSPGREGLGPDNRVVINEILANNGVISDTIELYNTTAAPLDISGWYVSDSTTYHKFAIYNGTTLPAAGFTSYSETDFNDPLNPNAEIPFGLSSVNGDDVYLLEADASGNLLRFVDHVAFGPTNTDESIGRVPDGEGGLVRLCATSFGQANAAAGYCHGPVVINEIMYNPAGQGGGFEFVELYNYGSTTQALSHWELRGEVDYDFPAITIAPAEALLIVPFDPVTNVISRTAFLTEYDLDESVRLYGPWSLGDSLDNGGGRVTLYRAGAYQPLEADPYADIVEDEVNYDDALPWPTAADGVGPSLELSGYELDNRLGSSWAASWAPNGTPGRHNDLDNPYIDVASVSLLEGDSGTQTAVLAVTLSYPSGVTVTVDASTVAASALAGNDFIAASSSLTYTPAITTQLMMVEIVGDEVYETNETLTVELSNAVNGRVRTAGVITITDNDPLPFLTIGDVSVIEGNSGPVTATFPLTLTHASSYPVTVDYSTAAGSAEASTDFTAAAGTVTFAAEQLTQTITVSINPDAIAESSETFVVNLANLNGAFFGDNQGQATIVDDDSTPVLSVGDVAVSEGDAGTTVLSFVVSLSAASDQAVTAQFATSDGTAVAGSDYTAAAGTLTFAPLQIQQTITITILGDAEIEADEQFTLTLTDVVGAEAGDLTAVGTILNDDDVVEEAAVYLYLPVVIR